MTDSIFRVAPIAGAANQTLEESRFVASRKRTATGLAPDPGVADVASEALRDSRVMSWGLVQRMFDSRDAEDQSSVDAGYSYSAIQDQVEKDMTWEEVQYLRENGVRGEGSLRRAQANVMMRRDTDAVYSKAGGAATFFGQMLAGMADPTALITGLGIGGLTARTAIGAGALVRAGRPLAAVGATVGENIAAELLFTGLQDASGEVLGMADYAMATAGAGLLSLGLSRGTYRAAAENQIALEARRIAQDAHTIERTAMTGDRVEMDNDAAVALWRQEQATRAVAETRMLTDTPVIPEDLRTQIVDEVENRVTEEVDPETGEPVVKPEETKAEEDTAVTVPEPQYTPDDALRVADELVTTGDPVSAREFLLDFIKMSGFDANELAALAKRAEALVEPPPPVIPAVEGRFRLLADKDAQTIEAWWSMDSQAKIDEYIGKTATGNPAPHVRATVREALQAIVDSATPRANPALARAAQALLNSAHSLDGAVIFKNTRRGHSAAEGVIEQPVAKGDMKPQRIGKDTTVQSLVDNMGDWAADTLVHEATHQATQRVLLLAEQASTRKLLSREVLEAVETLEDILARLRATLTPEQLKEKRGVGYAALDVHELVAMAMSDPATQRALLALPASPKRGGKWGTAFDELVAAIKTIMGMGLDGDTALDDVFQAVDLLMQVEPTARIQSNGRTALGWPGAEHPGTTPEPAFRKMAPLWDSPLWLAQRNVDMLRSPAAEKAVRELSDGEVSSVKDLLSLEPGLHVTLGARGDATMGPVIEAVEQLVAKYLPGERVVLSNTVQKHNLEKARGEMQTYKGAHVIGINTRLAYGAGAIRTAIHEVGHAIFHSMARDIPADLMARMKEDFGQFVQSVYENDPSAVARRYSATSVHRERVSSLKSDEYTLTFDEYTAEQFVKFVETRSAAQSKQGLDGFVRKVLVGLFNRMRDFFADTKKAGYIRPDESFEEFFTTVYTKAERLVGETVEAAGPINPVAAVPARKKFAERMYAHAEAFMAHNPIDIARLRVLTAKFGGGLSDGLRLASSNNPILQMVASLVTETTTGAAGRRANVAIRKETLKMKLVGNSRLDFEVAYEDWKARNKVGIHDDFVSGKARRKFDRAVYEEILARKQVGAPVSAEPSVRKAADAMQALYERSLAAQKEAGTLGSDRLPANSVGYIPQSLDGRKLAESSPEDLSELTEHLALHWETNLQWDARFARQFADFYVNRARSRVMNTASKDFSGASADGVSIMRESLEEMTTQTRDPALIAQATKAKRGLGQTKKRLDVGLMEVLPSGKRVLDFYEDDTMALAMRYVNRTSGTVALTEFGIPGPDGIRHLRDSATLFAADKANTPTREELEAFDRVMAEIMGQPVPGEVVSHGASGIRLFVMLQRLGSMVYTQAAETVNMVHHLGLSATLKGVTQLPRIFGEVGRVKKGANPNNHVLTHIETWGGEFGSHNYKMAFPLDPPDQRLETYMDDPGVLHRMLTAGAYYQSKLTGFRALMAAQHRMVAEQIVMKAARYIRDGKSDRWLADMGIDSELAGHFRLHLNRVAQWDQSGRLTKFDITQVPNPRAAEAMVQAVHRGVNQIIQGTFTGERNAWAHNDWIKVVTQLRTFGLTSTEKQWARVREVTGGGKQGYAAAAGLLIAQIAMVMPIIAARVHMASIGREDREEFIKQNLHPSALIRSAMNYTALSGMFGDVLDAIGGLAGSMLDEDQKELIGGRQGTGAGRVTDAIPALGSVDAAGRVATGNASVYSALKQLPFSNTPYLIPVINLFKE